MTKEFDKLYKEDQYHVKRWEKNYSDVEFHRINTRIRKKLQKLLDKGNAKTGRDYFVASIIFHHGFRISLSKRAIKYSEKSIEQGYKGGKEMLALTIDRLLVLQGKPQKFGSQGFELKSGKWKIYKVDPKTTDKERKEHGLPTLKEMKKRFD